MAKLERGQGVKKKPSPFREPSKQQKRIAQAYLAGVTFKISATFAVQWPNGAVRMWSVTVPDGPGRHIEFHAPSQYQGACRALKLLAMTPEERWAARPADKSWERWK